MLTAGIAFFGALFGIGSLLFLKRWELSHNRTVFSDTRQKADQYALQLKGHIFRAAYSVETLPTIFLMVLQRVVRRGAIAFGHLAHWLGGRSHELADLVSHKYRFERRETRSEFLKKVIEHPMRNTPRPSEISSTEETTFDSLQSPHQTNLVELEEGRVTSIGAAETVPLEEEQELVTTKTTSPSNRIQRSMSRARRIPTMVGETIGTAVGKVRRKKKSSKSTKSEETTGQSTPLESET